MPKDIDGHKMKRVGLIARQDKSGLGIQTRRLARMLNPDPILVIDSTPFNGNEQFPEWYEDYETITVEGFPDDEMIRFFLEELDVVVSCELFYNSHFTRIAKEMGVKTVLIANPEFFDWLKPEWDLVPRPDKVVVPSQWMLDPMRNFDTQYLPTPIFEDEFADVREQNLLTEGDLKFLFINGKSAVHDRNGLQILYSALEHSKRKFTVTVKSQSDIPKHPDPRLIYDFSNPEDQTELYRGFDALILPRRYGGQSLPMCEALVCGLPVIMPGIDPNNKVLPSEWLVPAYKKDQFMTRTMIDIYSVEGPYLAHKLDTLQVDLLPKLQAYEIGKQFEAKNLTEQYMELLR